jgi:DNA polymerase-3 subunit beta
MLSTTTKKDLLDIIQKTYPIVPAKSTLQILANFRVACDADTIEIMATDLDHSIRTKTKSSGGEPFEIAVNARKVFEIVRELPDGQVSIGLDGGLFVVRSEKGFECKIAGADCSDFPAFPDVESKAELTIPLATLSSMIAKSGFAVSRDESRACLCGILWEVEKDKSIMVATDGHRLGKTVVSGEFPVAKKVSVIVRPKTLTHAVRVAAIEGENTGQVTVVVGEKYLVLSVPGVELCSKLIDGPYPDYTRAIPANNPKKAVLDRKALVDAVRRVCVLSNQKTNLVKFSFSSGKLDLVVINRDIAGEARESLTVDYDGPDHAIGFNGQYLGEILQIAHTDKVRMEMNTEISACLLYPEATDAPTDDLFLIMPLRILEEV